MFPIKIWYIISSDASRKVGAYVFVLSISTSKHNAKLARKAKTVNF